MLPQVWLVALQRHGTGNGGEHCAGSPPGPYIRVDAEADLPAVLERRSPVAAQLETSAAPRMA